MSETRPRLEQWSKDHPLLATIAGAACMFLIVLAVLWVFAPRVSIDDALHAATLVAASTGGLYLAMKTQRQPSPGPRASIHPAFPAVLGVLVALYGLVPLNAGVDNYRETLGFVASELIAAALLFVLTPLALRRRARTKA